MIASEPCSFCAGWHTPIAPGVVVCPHVPAGHVYLPTEFGDGRPDGCLHLIQSPPTPGSPS